MRGNLISMKEVVLTIAKVAFYLYAFLWTIKPKIANSMSDVLELFYLDFLRVDRREIEVVRLAEDELITRCKNPCPILRLSELLSVDTKHACRKVSEPVCKFVLGKMNPNLAFERNYGWIRPFKGSCEERIYLKK